MRNFFEGLVVYGIYVIILIAQFPGGTIFMAVRCNSRQLSGWDWVLSVVIPFFGLFKGALGC